MKKKILLALFIILIIAIFYFFYRSKRNDSYKRIVNLFDEVKDENYFAYFFRYPNISKGDLENKIKLSMSINELYLIKPKDEYNSEEVKEIYKSLFGPNKYVSENTFFKDKTVIYENNKYILKYSDKDTKFKVYQMIVKKEYFFNKLFVYIRQGYIKKSHDRYDIYKFYDNGYIDSVDDIKEIENYEKDLNLYKFEFIMKKNKYYFERVGEVK